MSDADRAFHEHWLGLVQPVDGLVVSLPVLIDAQCMARRPAEVWHRMLELCPEGASGRRAIADLRRFLEEMLDLDSGRLHEGGSLPGELELRVSEGQQTLRPTLALRRDPAPPPPSGVDATPSSIAGSAYLALIWDLPAGLDLDRPETVTGEWEYPPTAKFDRLLRHCRVPVGILTNREAVRLIYAPHGEASGHLTFRLQDMATVGGRPILDALVMLLGAHRLYGAAEEHRLEALLAQSRTRQAGVTNELAGQVSEALQALLHGFEAAADRDGRALPVAGADEPDQLYEGLLIVMLRLVFVLYAEDRGLLPVDHPVYQEDLSLFGLFAQLRADASAWPDAMGRRFGAWSRVVSLFRAIHFGAAHGELRIPARAGDLFDPNRYPFLEGWEQGGSAPVEPAQRAECPVPTLDDGTVYQVLSRLLYLEGQRLSYKALEVEQIGAVYERVMGYRVVRLASEAVCLRPHRAWISGAELLAVPAGQRARWLQERAGITKRSAGRIQDALRCVGDPEAALQALDGERATRTGRGRAGSLVLQPTQLTTDSHYTPPTLTAPITERTLGPLVAAMGPEPSSERLLNLKICDPAVGSGAFLVAACRWLADKVVAAWTREGRSDLIAGSHEDVVNSARRLVAQRCLYGVDKNPVVVTIARLSLWLHTLAKDLPFTFLDHSVRWGESLVGLDLDQIRGFHWSRSAKPLAPIADLVEQVLGQAIDSRVRILELAADPSPGAQREKAWALADATDALDPVRIVGDLVIGAFFSGSTDKEREKERVRRQELVAHWLASEGPVPDELRRLSSEIRARYPVFHWPVELPEVFWVQRPDPLCGDKTDGTTWMEAFLGNPPFAGKNTITEVNGEGYVEWLQTLHEGANGNSDYSAHFFRRAAHLIGDHGTMGLIATNTISQGDTRSTGLQHLVRSGFEITAGTRNLVWPGEAAVTVSVLNLSRGSAIQPGRVLDDQPVPAINSRMSGRPERPDPAKLSANDRLSFVGSYVLGSGFTLTPAERDALVARDARNAERIFPYLGGEEVNQNPDQGFDRYVINFGQMSLDEAEQWPDLIAIVREKVKPQRDLDKRDVRRKYWWRFGEAAPALYDAIQPLSRCLVTSIVTKHLLFSFQPTNRVFSHSLSAFPLTSHASLAVLQSRIHSSWAWLLSSTMKQDLRYSADDCFTTFPFPSEDPRAVIPELELVGARLDELRRDLLLERRIGLTTCYNRLRDPTETDPRLVALRELHLELDRAVLDAYGFHDVAVPPYTAPKTASEHLAVQQFEEEVLDRLFVLNEDRAKQERLRGAAPTGRKRKPAEPQVSEGHLTPVPAAAREARSPRVRT